MIKKTVFFSLVISILFLAGCQSLMTDSEKAVSILSKAVYVDQLVKTGAIEDSLFSSPLTTEETDVINQSLRAYNNFVEAWGGVISKNPLEAIKKTSVMINHYGVLRIKYEEVERVVKANWDKYPPENQFLLLEYQKQAHELDGLVMGLLEKSKTSTAFIAIQRMGIVVGQIALKLI